VSKSSPGSEPFPPGVQIRTRPLRSGHGTWATTVSFANTAHKTPRGDPTRAPGPLIATTKSTNPSAR
jgi:hypothetical protein